MSPHVLVGLSLAAAAAAIFAPSVIDRALRNRRTRQARAQRLAEVRNFWLDSEPMEAWDDDPTPTHDRLVCEQMEKAEGWAS